MFVWCLSRCLAPQKHTVHSNVTFIGSILSFLNKRSPNPRVNVAPEKQLHHFGREQRDGSRVVLRLVRLCFVVHLCVCVCVFFKVPVSVSDDSSFLHIHPTGARRLCQVRELMLGEGRWRYCVFASSARFCVCARD